MSSQIIKVRLLIPEQAYLYTQETHVIPHWGGRIWCTWNFSHFHPLLPIKAQPCPGDYCVPVPQLFGVETWCAIKLRTTVPVSECELRVTGFTTGTDIKSMRLESVTAVCWDTTAHLEWAYVLHALVVIFISLFEYSFLVYFIKGLNLWWLEIENT